MNGIKPFTDSEVMVKLDASFFTNLFSVLIESASKIEHVPLGSLKFYYQGDSFDPDDRTFENMVNAQVRPLDLSYFLYFREKNYPVKFEKREQKTSYTLGDYRSALFCLYYLLITRDKMALSNDETFPKFLDFTTQVVKKDFTKILTDNVYNFVNHDWIFQINIAELGSFVQSRLLKGIAGMRFMQVIKRFEIKDSAPEEAKLLAENLKKKLEGNVYKECHPRGQPREIQQIGLSKNLSNFVLEYYPREALETLVKEKVLREMPKPINDAYHYRTWTRDFFDYIKTPLYIPIVEQPRKTSKRLKGNTHPFKNSD